MAIISYLVAILATMAISSALPIEEEYPEVIPGPGMPSLASLRLTSRGLHHMKPVMSLQERSAQASLICSTGAVCPISDAQACVNYLNNLGSQNCVVSNDHQVFVQVGNCTAFGSRNGVASTSSYCGDVGAGGQAIIDNCSQQNNSTQGSNAAAGNGNLIFNLASTA